MVRAVHRNHDAAAMLRSMEQVDLRIKKAVIKTRPADRRAIAAIIGRTAVMRRNLLVKSG
jgi:hypothetical protein